MIIEIDLINVLREKENYIKYKKYIKQHAISKETKSLLEGMGLYFDTYTSKKEIDWGDFQSWFLYIANKSLSKTEEEEYNAIFAKLVGYKSTNLSEDIIKNFIKLDYATKIADKVQLILDGNDKHKLEDLQMDIEEYSTGIGIDLSSAKAEIDTDLTSLLNKCIRSGGYYWKLQDLNYSIGPLHKGDFIVIAARPETGKTTFIVQESVHLASQDNDGRPVLILNNEEMGEKIGLRAYQSVLGKTMTELQSNEATNKAEFEKAMGGPDRFKLIDEADLNIRFCEQQIKRLNPSIIVFNVLDKVQGFDKAKGNEEQRQRKLAIWARGLAKKYDCIVFDIAQADGGAEGQRWIYKNQIYGSKTGIPAEADVLITIGMVHDATMQNVRFIHVPKNKLPGDSRTDPKKKHGYFEVEFDGERGMYKSLVYK